MPCPRRARACNRWNTGWPRPRTSAKSCPRPWMPCARGPSRREKLLAEMRQSLVARTEEIRATEAKLVEAVLGRSGAEKKAEQLTAANEAHDRQHKKLEKHWSALSVRRLM